MTFNPNISNENCPILVFYSILQGKIKKEGLLREKPFLFK